MWYALVVLSPVPELVSEGYGYAWVRFTGLGRVEGLGMRIHTYMRTCNWAGDTVLVERDRPSACLERVLV